MRGRPRDPQAPAWKPSRRPGGSAGARAMACRSAPRPCGGRPVAGHDGELREEQADARGAVVEVRLERAVLEPPRLRGVDHRAHPVAAAAVPDRVGHDAIGRSAAAARNATSEDMAAGERRLAVGRVELTPASAKRAATASSRAAVALRPASCARTIASARSAQRRSPKLSPVAAVLRQPDAGGERKREGRDRRRRCGRSASATSQQRGRRAAKRPAGEVQHRGVAAVEAQRMVGDLSRNGACARVEPAVSAATSAGAPAARDVPVHAHDAPPASTSARASPTTVKKPGENAGSSSAGGR